MTSAARVLLVALVILLVAAPAAAKTTTVPSSSFAPDVTELPANAGTAFGETFLFRPPNVIGPVQWQVAAGALPPGLSIFIPPLDRPVPPPSMQNFMRIVGTPTTEGVYTFTLRASDRNGLTGTRAYTIRVNPPLPVSITPQAWGPLEVGAQANLFLDGAGGVKPYAWSVSAGALPPGMSVVQDSTSVGLVRVGGTPTAAGSYDWTLRLTDARGTVLDRAFTVSVAPTAGRTLEEVAVTPTTTGGRTVIASVRISPPAPPGGVQVALSSSNPATASVPASVTLAEGDTVGAFPVTTSAVSADTQVTISARLGTISRTTPLTVTPPATTPPPPPNPPPANADTVSISRAEYDSAKRQLRISASSSAGGATLRAYVTSTDALIGTLSAGSGQFALPANPQSITIKSSLGGAANRAVTVK